MKNTIQEIRENRREHQNLRKVSIAGIALLLNLFAVVEIHAQWTAPQVYVKQVTDNWQIRYPGQTGDDYELSLTRWSEGSEKSTWIFDWLMKDAYGTGSSVQSYNAWQWNGSAYDYKLHSSDTWHSSVSDMQWPSAWERIQYGMQGYPYWRSKNTLLEMDTGGSEKNNKYVLLVASAWEYTGWSGVTPTASQEITHDKIHVGGAYLNPDFRRFRKVSANTTVSSTVYATVSSYNFTLSIESHKIQTLTSSKHPNAGYRNWQTAFDIGSDALGKDDDGDGNSGATEDQGCYVEFIIKPAAISVFPTQFHTNSFNMITRVEQLNQLANASFANLKTVTSIELEDPMYPDDIEILHGYGPPPSDSMVLDSGAASIIPIHEYGHLNWLLHRGDQGEVGMETAIMNPYGDPAIRNEVNGSEISSFESEPLTVMGL